jgi:hypothetical protein
MPTRGQFANGLLELPLVRALRTIAVRLGMRFALRGGVLRNFLFASLGEHLPEKSFYEYVDPFSDIGMVVEDTSDWPQLAHAIASSIPFAGFHHWEATSIRAMKQSAKRYTMIPADRLLLWFEGREKTFSRVFLDGLDINVDEVVQSPSLQIDTKASRPEGKTEVFDQILDVLQLMKYAAAFPELKSDVDPADLMKRSEFKRRIAARHPSQRGLTATERRKLEMAILDLVFTASDWNRASHLLNMSRLELPPVWLEGSKFLSSVFYQSALSAGSGVGVVLYKPGPRSRSHLRIFNDTRPVWPGLQNVSSLIPWVRLSCLGHNPTDCCNYNDFQNGVATVAWRSKSPGFHYSALKESEFAVVAAAIPSSHEYSMGASKSELPLFSVPAFVRKGTSVVIRMDHGYIGALLNRNASFFLGLVRSAPR